MIILSCMFCGGILELLYVLIVAIIGFFSGKKIKSIRDKKHGVHGAEECNCKCHKKLKDKK